MLVNNLIDKVYILFNEEYTLSGKTYLIKSVGTFNCVSDNIKLQGIVENDSIILQLDDGKYVVEVISEDGPNFKEVFVVYYNGLPDIIKDIKNALCPCKQCLDITLEALFKTYFKVSGFIEFIGLSCELYSTTVLKQKFFKVLKDELEYQQYYNTFKFSYEKALKDLLANLYIELYSLSTNQLSTSDNDLESINSVFKVDIMEKCLYKLDYDFNDILCLINNSKCKCNCNE